METKTFAIEGLRCPNCKARVEEGLKKMNGIGNADASVENKQITITYDPAAISIEQMQEAVEDMGYDLKV